MNSIEISPNPNVGENGCPEEGLSHLNIPEKTDGNLESPNGTNSWQSTRESFSAIMSKSP